MNLRKDHLHIFWQEHNDLVLWVLVGMCCYAASSHTFRDVSHGQAGCLLSACCCVWASLCLVNPLYSFLFQGVNPLCHHNFQHWMSWLGWWWRVQQSVISMLNSRISWINRDLNAHCAFGVFLKACLLQRLFFNIPEAMPWLSHAWLVHALCVTAAMPLTHVMDSLSACLLHPIEDRCLVECMWLVPGLSF